MMLIMSGWSEHVVIVGIDEAGYGPILGPLVVSAAAFEVPRADWHRCLWESLTHSVSNGASARDGRIAIQDSKKLFHRKHGLAKLERSVLAVFGGANELPPDLARFLAAVAPDVIPQMKEYAWYRNSDLLLPYAADAGAIRIAAARFARDLAAKSVRQSGMWSEVLPEGHFNRLVGVTQNKASALFGLVLRLIHRAAAAHPDRDIHFLVDKQGARDRYGPLLLRAFEDRQLRILSENDEESEYELQSRLTKWRIRFSQSGEAKYLPIALASMVSKYLRELFMERFNAYWRQHAADLVPTAGYYEDGMRFLKDIEPHARRLGIRREQLVRER